MKKIHKMLLVSLFALAAFTVPKKAEAQGTFSQTASNPTGAISNTGIDTMTYTLAKAYGRVLVGMTYVRSANTAAGTAILEYKVRSTDNWVADAGDTLTITNVASRTYLWNKTVPARYWRIRVGGATTVTATVSAGISAAN